MRQALQALIAEMEYVLSCINEDKIPFDGDDFHEALRLGKEALAQPEQDYPKDFIHALAFHTAMSDLEPDQEPVGWLDSNDKLAEFMHKDLKAEHDKRASSTPRDFQIPVYTTPPQRKPLTDEQLFKLWDEDTSCDMPDTFKQFKHTARAIEAAHGIKE